MDTKTCKTCSASKPLSDFSTTDKKRGYLYPHCKPCTAAKKRAERHANPQEYKDYQRAYYEANKDRLLPYYRKANLKCYHAMKAELFTMLGGKCLHCGLGDSRVLQVDHVNGGGGRERMSVGHSKSLRKMRDALRAGTDEGQWQLLCGNCHILKTLEATP